MCAHGCGAGTQVNDIWNVYDHEHDGVLTREEVREMLEDIRSRSVLRCVARAQALLRVRTKTPVLRVPASRPASRPAFRPASLQWPLSMARVDSRVMQRVHQVHMIQCVLARASTLIPRVYPCMRAGVDGVRVGCCGMRVYVCCELCWSSFVKKGHRNVPEENFIEAFDSLDADHDGKVTKVRSFCAPSHLSYAHLPCHGAHVAECEAVQPLSLPPVQCLYARCMCANGSTSSDAH